MTISENLYQKLGETWAETSTKLQKVYEWFKHFQDGWQYVDRDIFRKARQLYGNISNSSIQSIPTEDFGMEHVSAKFMPKLFSVEQKENQFSAV